MKGHGQGPWGKTNFALAFIYAVDWDGDGKRDIWDTNKMFCLVLFSKRLDGMMIDMGVFTAR